MKETLHIQARANIEEVHFLPFNPVDKRTAITYIDSDGNWYRASKGAPEQVSISLKRTDPTFHDELVANICLIIITLKHYVTKLSFFLISNT